MTYSYSDFQLKIIDEHHPLKALMEVYVSQRYHRAFKATLTEFMPCYLALYQKEKLISVCGVRCAEEGALFLEQYLAQPIESIVNPHYPYAKRSDIIEFGQLASFSTRFSAIHFYLMARYLSDAGYEWCVCTVTDPLFTLMENMGLQPISIGKAAPQMVSHPELWGQYYQYSPKIIFGSLKQAQQQLQTMSADCDFTRMQLG